MPKYTMPDGEQLFVREIGRGEPVLVLSGLGMQSWQWLPFLLPNLNKYKFIIPDWHGFGGSKNCAIPQDLDTIQSHWRDIDSLIIQLKLNDFMLIAYSMGATTAMHGMQYGNLKEKLKAYLHIDQTPQITTNEDWSFGLFGQKHDQFKRLLLDLSQFLHQHAQYRYIDELTDQDRTSLVKIWLNFIQLQGSSQVNSFLFKLALQRPQLQKRLLPIRRLDYMTWYTDNYLNHAENYRDAIAKFELPTTFFIGEKSTLYPSEGQRLVSSCLKNANNVIFKRSGHTPLITEPVKFTQHIHQFLKQNI